MTQPINFQFKFLRLSALLVLIAFLTFSPCIQNDFTNWDDESFVLQNIAIRDLSWPNLKKIFNQYNIGSYQPLTVFSFAVEYKFFKLDPKIYHTTNVALHIFNTVLVFGLIYLLCQNLHVAFWTALFFSIHPLRVESVAWVAQRKDVLYSFFYLSSLICYVLYLKKNASQKRFIIFSFILFLLSCLSKVQATTLPAVLILLDYYFARRFTLSAKIHGGQAWLEKIPFVILSVIFLCVNWSGTQPIVLVERGFQGYGFIQKFFLTHFAVVFYLIKTFVPFPLSAMYPFPERINGHLPLFIYFSPFILLSLITLLFMIIRPFAFRQRRIRLWRRQKLKKPVAFGSLFFIITILLPLTNIWMSQYLTSDRYTYIPSIGLFFVIFSLLQNSATKNARFQKIFLFLIVMLAVIFSYLSFKRCFVWRNSLTLWNDTIDQYPQIPVAYLNRGIAYADQNLYELALKDYTKAIALQPNYRNAYYNRGRLFHILKKYNLALSDLDKTTSINPYDDIAYVEKGIVYKNLGHNDLALKNYTKAIQINPFYAGAFNNRGVVYVALKQMGAALADFTEAMRLNPYEYGAYVNRGNLYLMLQKPHLGLEDYNNAIELNPRNPIAYIQKAHIAYQNKNYSEALLVLTAAAQKNPNSSEVFYTRALTQKALGNKKAALDDALKAKTLGHDIKNEFLDSLKF